jgi:subfamily B ATP-binding cassette protein MsbA
MAFFGFAALSLILWYGGREVLDGRLTGGELIAFLIYGLTVAGSLASLVGLYASFQEALGATKRVFQLMDMQPGVLDAPDAAVLPHVDGRITFEGVGFSYDDRSRCWKELTWTSRRARFWRWSGRVGRARARSST